VRPGGFFLREKPLCDFALRNGRFEDRCSYIGNHRGPVLATYALSNTLFIIGLEKAQPLHREATRLPQKGYRFFL
jgi:hypothetical protein